MFGSRMQVSLPNDILIAEVGRLLNEGKDVVLMTKGSSMLPYILGERDSVLLRKTKEINEGDVVLAEVGKSHYVLHRIVRIEGEEVTLRGDGNIVGCERCRPGDILGTVIEISAPSGKSRKPGRAVIWRHLGAFPRRCILAVYRRTVLKIIKVK